MQLPEQPSNVTILDGHIKALARARDAVRRYRAEHIGVLDVLTHLDAEAAAAEAAFKTAIRPTGVKRMEAYGLVVTVTHPISVSYDAMELLRGAPSLWTDHPAAFKVEADKAEVGRLVDLGVIQAELAQAARREKAGTPAVTIKAAP